MAKLDILFVKPGSQKSLYGSLNDFELTGIEPPFWGAMLAGYMRGRGYSTAIIDAEAESLAPEKTAERIRELSPSVTVITVSGTNPSASTMNMVGASSIVDAAKRITPDSRIVFHGLHPSSLPEQSLNETNADYICKGEGFVTLPLLVDAIKADRPVEGIQGLIGKSGAMIFKNPAPAVLPDLDVYLPSHGTFFL